MGLCWSQNELEAHRQGRGRLDQGIEIGDGLCADGLIQRGPLKPLTRTSVRSSNGTGNHPRSPKTADITAGQRRSKRATSDRKRKAKARAR